MFDIIFNVISTNLQHVISINSKEIITQVLNRLLLFCNTTKRRIQTHEYKNVVEQLSIFSNNKNMKIITTI